MFGSCFNHPMCGPQTKTVGGGGSAPVANALSGQILDWITKGFPGPQNTAAGQQSKADPIGQALATLLGSGSGNADSTKAILDKQRTSDVANLREQYGMGGTGFGTPGAVAEGSYLADFNPKAALAINDAHMSGISKAMQFLIPLLTQQSGLGTPQAETAVTPGPLSDILGTLTAGAGAASKFIGPRGF